MIEGWGKDVILTTGPLVGLGDHMLWSTLPKRFKDEGHNVLLDSECYARNDEIFDILWKGALEAGDIDALTDRKPNAGYGLGGEVHGRFYDLLQFFPEGHNIEVMERAHNFPPPYSMAPRIYYTPQPYFQDLSQSVLFDFSALSSEIADEGWKAFVTEVWGRRYHNREMVLAQQKTEIGGRRQLHFPIQPSSIAVKSIYQFCDMIASCHAIMCSEAGAQALAAAIRGEHPAGEEGARPDILSLMTVTTRNSRAFCYRGVDYHSSLYFKGSDGILRTGMDYLNPVEVHTARYAAMCRIDGNKRMQEWRAAR